MLIQPVTSQYTDKKILVKTSQRVVSAVSVRPFAKYSCSITQYMHELRPQSSSIPKTA